MTRASEKVAVPRLRFKGCEGAWSSEPFAKFVERRTVAADDDRLPCVEYEDIVSGEGRLNDAFPKKQTHKKGLLFEPDDVLFGKLRPYLRNQLRAEFKGIAVGDFWVFRGTSICGKFLYALTESEGFQFIANISAGSKMPRSDWNLVSSTQFSYPHDSMEQDKIGQGFQTIDTTVSLCESRLSSLRQLKRAMLVKMFPQPGQCVPEIRFKGFGGKWKEKRLGCSFTMRHEENADKRFTEILSVMKDIGVIRYADKGNVGNKAKEDMSRYMVARADDIVLNSMNVIIGSVGVSHYDGCISPVYYALTPKAETCSEFFGYWFWRKETQKLLASRACGMMEIRRKVSESDLLAISVLTPTLPEQRKIAAFFRNLDRLIGAVEKKVMKLRKVKSSLLERMFV